VGAAVLRRRWFVDANQCKHDGGSDGGASLSLNAMWSVFMIPVAGAALAALALLMEWVYYRQYYKSEWRWLCAGSSQEWWQQFTASRVLCQH